MSSVVAKIGPNGIVLPAMSMVDARYPVATHFVVADNGWHVPVAPQSGLLAYTFGPMTRYVHYNFAAFDTAKRILMEHGWQVVSPADLDRENGFDPYLLPDNYDWSRWPESMDRRDVIRRDFNAIIASDAMYGLPGWRPYGDNPGSEGGQWEYATGRLLRMPIYEAAPWLIPGEAA